MISYVDIEKTYLQNSSAEFFTWMCENMESCDYQCDHSISMCSLYAYLLPERHDGKKSVYTQLKAILLQVYDNFDNLQQRGIGRVRWGGYQKLPVSEHCTVVSW